MKAYIRGITAKYIYQSNKAKQDWDNQLVQEIGLLEIAHSSDIRLGNLEERACYAQFIRTRSLCGQGLKNKVAASYTKHKAVQYKYGEQVGRILAHQISYRRAGGTIERVIDIDGSAHTRLQSFAMQFYTFYMAV
ncbi:hypothetical protein NDU88_004064 [Pleurodeles waltl]|uniref:Uncharacterized protein n=1 Tax=Pleurodeles waltl TaxID=8319 RepID=A0AAV7V073_PLEWA|nr:hypothetical protein NDU88_004064 [Pleurodeles waltl]